MKTNERIILRRDCEAIQIPNGNMVTLPAGSEVRIMQSLGGTYTVMTSNGSLVRIAEADTDALGKETALESLAGASPTPVGPADVEQLVWDQLRTASIQKSLSTSSILAWCISVEPRPALRVGTGSKSDSH
jgi:hypothetical protein